MWVRKINKFISNHFKSRISNSLLAQMISLFIMVLLVVSLPILSVIFLLKETVDVSFVFDYMLSLVTIPISLSDMTTSVAHLKDFLLVLLMITSYLLVGFTVTLATAIFSVVKFGVHLVGLSSWFITVATVFDYNRLAVIPTPHRHSRFFIRAFTSKGFEDDPVLSDPGRCKEVLAQFRRTKNHYDFKYLYATRDLTWKEDLIYGRLFGYGNFTSASLGKSGFNLYRPFMLNKKNQPVSYYDKSLIVNNLFEHQLKLRKILPYNTHLSSWDPEMESVYVDSMNQLVRGYNQLHNHWSSFDISAQGEFPYSPLSEEHVRLAVKINNDLQADVDSYIRLLKEGKDLPSIYDVIDHHQKSIFTDFYLLPTRYSSDPAPSITPFASSDSHTLLLFVMYDIAIVVTNTENLTRDQLIAELERISANRVRVSAALKSLHPLDIVLAYPSYTEVNGLKTYVLPFTPGLLKMGDHFSIIEMDKPVSSK